jgi:hypothetical protein
MVKEFATNVKGYLKNPVCTKVIKNKKIPKKNKYLYSCIIKIKNTFCGKILLWSHMCILYGKNFNKNKQGDIHDK